MYFNWEFMNNKDTIDIIVKYEAWLLNNNKKKKN